MAVKKTESIKKTESSETINNKKSGRISYKELSEELKLKLKQSEEKIAELNQKYKKVVDIQKKKIEDKYKKIIEDLEQKKSIPAKTQSNSTEISKLQKKLDKFTKYFDQSYQQMICNLLLYQERSISYEILSVKDFLQ